MKKRNLNRLKFNQKKSNLGADHLTSEGVNHFRKKISCRLISRKYLPYNDFACQGKKSITRGLGKKFLHVPKPNHPYPTSKVKWLAPKKAKGLK